MNTPTVEEMKMIERREEWLEIKVGGVGPIVDGHIARADLVDVEMSNGAILTGVPAGSVKWETNGVLQTEAYCWRPHGVDRSALVALRSRDALSEAARLLTKIKGTYHGTDEYMRALSQSVDIVISQAIDALVETRAKD